MTTATIYDIASAAEKGQNTRAILAGCRYLLQVSRAIGGQNANIRNDFFTSSRKDLKRILGIQQISFSTPRAEMLKRDGISHGMMLLAEEMLGGSDFFAFQAAFKTPVKM